MTTATSWSSRRRTPSTMKSAAVKAFKNKPKLRQFSPADETLTPTTQGSWRTRDSDDSLLATVSPLSSQQSLESRPLAAAEAVAPPRTAAVDQPTLDSLSLSSQDIQLFSSGNQIRQMSSEYFSLSGPPSLIMNHQRLPPPRLPVFGRDEILVKPASNNNWILLPSESWRRESKTTIPGTANSSCTTEVLPMGQELEDDEVDSTRLRRVLNTLINFIGPQSQDDDIGGSNSKK